MNSHILLSTDLITNFKPSYLNNFNQLNFFKQRSNQIFCKNFFLYLLLLKYKSNFFIKSTVFIKPFKKKIYTILRSPYRHKLARHQIALKRYEVRSTIKIKIKNYPIFVNFKSILHFFKILKNYITWFESNIIFVHKSKFNFNFFFEKNFNLALYNIETNE